MTFPVMRRLAGLVLALVWSGARLAQPLQPNCPHHASNGATMAAAVVLSSLVPTTGEHAHHLVQSASVTLSDVAPTDHQHAPDRPCDCAAHCCAASAVAIGVDAPVFGAPTVLAASAPRLLRATRPPLGGVPHRQPPATAPPALTAV